jgi:hypothetical protein
MSVYYTAEIHFSCTLPVNKSLQDEYACKMADKKQIADWDNFWNDAAVKAVDSDREPEPTCPTPPTTRFVADIYERPMYTLLYRVKPTPVGNNLIEGNIYDHYDKTPPLKFYTSVDELPTPPCHEVYDGCHLFSTF